MWNADSNRRREFRRLRFPAAVLVSVVAVAAALVPYATYAQPPANGDAPERPSEQDVAESMEQLRGRVAALERLVASIDTRFAAREAARPPLQAGQPVPVRLDDLERQMAQITLDVQRLQTLVDNAMRTAENAQRAAMQAENIARDAQFRASQ